MRKPKITPQEAMLIDKLGHAQLSFERAYTRMRRAVNTMHKSRRTIIRCQKNLKDLSA